MSTKDHWKRASELDAADALGDFRDRFHIPVGPDGSEVVYLVGNSLGLQPRTTSEFVSRELEKWKTLGVAAHFAGGDPWMPYHELVREPMAGLVGALPHEVVVMNSLTVNLHLLMATFYRPVGARRKIMTEGQAFPSDRYAVASQLRHHGFSTSDGLIRLEPRDGEFCLETSEVTDAIRNHAGEIALVLLGGVNYYTGQVLDMQTIAAVARECEVLVGFDLAHAAGNIPLSLHEWDVDFASWCSYKYLNAGPGGIAGCFVHERHARDRSLPRLAGWWGHDPATRFQMPEEFMPMDSADGWQLSNPPILLLAALRASLQIFHEAGMARLREKSLKLTGFLRELLDEMQGPFKIITPREPGASGCQISLLFERDVTKVFEALEQSGVMCDYREPDVIRVAPVPLYNSFADVTRFVSILRSAL